MAALEQAARDKSNALALIEDREREIRAIRDGQITSKRVRKNIPHLLLYTWILIHSIKVIGSLTFTIRCNIRLIARNLSLLTKFDT